MRCELNYSPQFLDDLVQIGEYIETRFFDPAAAVRITEGILNTTDILAEFPEKGAVVYLPGGADSGYRYVVFEHYLAVYAIRHDSVYVTRAIHVKQDYLRVLFSSR